MSPIQRNKSRQLTPGPPQGWAMTHLADHYFVQEQLKHLSITKPPLIQQPTLLDDWLVTLTQGH